jgi:hypothetical protein
MRSSFLSKKRDSGVYGVFLQVDGRTRTNQVVYYDYDSMSKQYFHLK